MAKTKKKEKIVDLKAKAEKITTEELKKIQGLVGDIEAMTSQIGRMEITKHGYLHRLAGANEQMVKTQEEMKSKYGTNDINVVNGTINYAEENGEVNKKD